VSFLAFWLFGFLAFWLFGFLAFWEALPPIPTSQGHDVLDNPRISILYLSIMIFSLKEKI